MKKFLLFIILFLSTFIVKSQDFSPDRPGIGSSTGLITKHRFQLETGYYYSKDETSYNNLLLRYGLIENIELRFNSNLVKSSDGITGFQPLIVGIKIKMLDNEFIIPATSLISQLRFPNNGKINRTHIISPSYYFLFTNKITNKLILEYNIGMETQEEKFVDYYLKETFMGSVGLTYDLGKNYSTFFEVYNNYNDNTSFDFGFTKTVKDKMQFDLSYINGNKSINVGFVFLF